MGCSLMKKYSIFSKSEDWANIVRVHLIVVVPVAIPSIIVPSVGWAVLTNTPIVT